MLVCILGLSASGKDHVSKIISDKYGLKRIVQFTTRPMRNNELDGVDYNFINQELFEKLISEGKFLSYRIFDTISEKYYYGIKKDSFNFSKNCIICIDIEGLEEILEKLHESQIISIFIDADYNTRKKRAIQRSNFNSDEFERRYQDDLNKLDKINEKCNYIVGNNDSENCIWELCNILKSKLRL